MKDNETEIQTDGFFDNPRTIKILMYTFYGICVVLFLLDLVIHRHTYRTWEDLIGFYAIFGFVGCVILVLVASWMRTWLMRPEDYYSNQADSQNISRLTTDDNQTHVGSDSSCS